MMNAARQIWAIAHEQNILFKVSHIFGRDNVFADVLSRAHLSKEDAKKLKDLQRLHQPTMIEVSECDLSLQDYKISK